MDVICPSSWTKNLTPFHATVLVEIQPTFAVAFLVSYFIKNPTRMKSYYIFLKNQTLLVSQNLKSKTAREHSAKKRRHFYG
jgi:hypothetical protein